MVTCNLIGRLGNQMFQLATAYAHALRMGADFRAPEYSLDKRIWPTYFWHLPKRPRGYHTEHFYNEPEHSYTPIPDWGDVTLQGYFQSEKYFKQYREQVLELFALNVGDIIVKGAVGVHVRRGDYLTMQEKHPVLPTIYYDQATSMFPGHKFLVFSDDPAWCKSWFVGGSFRVMPPTTPLIDLQLMSGCEHQIIANSSFSWWAAWLNNNPDKKVVAPRQWFGPDNNHLSIKDLIPETWTIL